MSNTQTALEEKENMKYELAGNSDGVELYNPVAENELEARQLEINKDIFMNTLADLIIKYGPKLLEELKEEADRNTSIEQ